MICVLQFDAASVRVLERLLGEGRLPHLAELGRHGRRVGLETPAVDFAAGAFPTLYSGVELGDHGIFYPFQWSAAEQRARYATAFDAPPAVWERLARSGLRTLAIDPYESRPPAGAHDGVLVCGWGFADRVVLPRWSRPRGVERPYARRLGRGPGATEIFGTPRIRDLLALRRKLVAAPGRVAALAERLLGRESFDLAWLTFSAAHLAGHQFWDLSQLDRGTLTRGDRRALESAIDDVYAAVDAAFGRILAALPAGTDVIVTSAVGMDVNTSRADLLPGMLARVLAGGPIAESAGSIWRLRAAIPAGARGRIAAALPAPIALELTSRLELRGIDWATARAFAHPADNQGYVRLNLRGRERDGIVDPADAGALAEEVAAGLATFSDPDGAPAVAAVVPAPPRYPGERGERLPDLVVRWSERPATTLGHVRSERFGEVRRHGGGSGRSGNHTPGDAWALAVPGRGAHAEPSRPARLVDVAATVCELTGADGADLAGEPLLRRVP